MASSNSKSNYDVKDQDIEYLWWKYVEDDASYIASNVHWLEDNTICPVCGSSQVSFIFNKTSFNYLTCHDCTHVFFSKKVTDEGMNWYYAHGKALRHGIALMKARKIIDRSFQKNEPKTSGLKYLSLFMTSINH